MKWRWICLSALVLGLSGCSQAEQEEEPNYDQMVMQEEEDEIWIAEEERDRKVIAGDLPDPQEQIILEPFERP